KYSGVGPCSGAGRVDGSRESHQGSRLGTKTRTRRRRPARRDESGGSGKFPYPKNARAVRGQREPRGRSPRPQSQRALSEVGEIWTVRILGFGLDLDFGFSCGTCTTRNWKVWDLIE